MCVAIIGISIFIVLCVIFMYLIGIYNKYQNYIIRINEAEANIDSTLRKRFDLLNKSIGIIKANTNIEEAEAVSEDSNSDSDEQTLIALWRTYKESNPEGTLDDFYKDVLGTNSEVQ
jgi:hypothetical protein